MLSLALAAVLAQAPVAEAIVVSPQPTPAQGIYLSIYPGGSLAGLAALPMAGIGMAVPVGAQFPLSPHLAVDVDVSAAFTMTIGAPGWALTAAAGPTWFPFDTQAGFFIGPRFNFLIGQAARRAGPPASSGPLDLGPSVRRAFLVGFDTGWQFRVGRLIFGPVLGASVGLHFDSAQPVATPFEVTTSTFGGGTTVRTDTFAVGFNLNLFRVGVRL